MSMQDKILAAVTALDAKVTAHIEADTAALAALQAQIDTLKAELEATGVIDDSTIVAAIEAVGARL